MKKFLFLFACALLSIMLHAQAPTGPLGTTPRLIWSTSAGQSGYCVNDFDAPDPQAVCSVSICLGESVCFSYSEIHAQQDLNDYNSNHLPLYFSTGGSIMIENAAYAGPNPTGCVNFVPTGAGVITTSGGANNYPFTICVLPAVAMPLSANLSPNNPVCEGTKICAQSLTSPVINYNFSSATNVVCSSTVNCTTPNTTPFCFPAGTHQIVYTVNAGHTCSNTAVYTVNVVIPPLGISIITPSACANNYCFTANVLGACNLSNVNYEWTVTDQGSYAYQFSGPSPNLCLNLAPGIYNILVYAGANNFANATLVVPTSDPCVCYQCNAIGTGGTINVSPPSYQKYCINNNVSISGNISFNDIELRMKPNVTLTVLNGAVLTINHSRFFGDKGMWAGIVVQNGGRINILNNSLLEDAIVGIDVINSGLTTQILTVDNSIFNKNVTDIRINNYPIFLGPGPYPFTITNSLFTCRDITNCSSFLAWPATAAVKAANNPVTSPLQTPYINNTTYPVSSLKAPYVGKKSSFGIRVVNAGSSVVTNNVAVYGQITIGTSGGTNSYNVFDNHYIGVDAQYSNVSVVNSIFQNGWEAFFPTMYSCGIKAVTNTSYNHRLLVNSTNYTNNNKFYDVSRAVRAENYFELGVTFCEMYSTRVFNSGVATQRGAYGVSAQTNHYSLANMNYNKIYNIDYAIDFKGTVGTFTVGSATAANGQYLGVINANSNLIRSHVNAPNPAQHYGARAITITGLLGGIKVTRPNAEVNTNSNVIYDYVNGISVSNYRFMRVASKVNQVTIRANTANVYQYGIEHLNNALTGPFSFKQYGIVDNTVSSIGSAPLSQNYGIRSVQNDNYAVLCNTITANYNGVAFSGYHPNNAFVRFNIMAANHYGFVLENQGRIGTQGSGNGADFAENQWQGAFVAPNFKTAVINSNAKFSKMYVRNTPGFNPNGSGFIIGGAQFVNDYSQSAGTILTAGYEGTFYNCFSPKPSFGEPSEDYLSDLLTNSTSPADIHPAALHVAKTQLYNYLKEFPLAYTSSPVLKPFYVGNTGLYRDIFNTAEGDVSEGNTPKAQETINTYSTQNSIEFRHKEYLQILFRYQNQILFSTDESNLLNLANGCPSLQGTVVHQARALYNLAYDRSVLFTDNCNYAQQSYRLGNSESEEEPKGMLSEDVFLYPNPSSGKEVFISLAGATTERIEVTVGTVNGLEIHRESLTLTGGIAKLDLDAANGVYVISILNTQTQQRVVKKLVIQK